MMEAVAVEGIPGRGEILPEAHRERLEDALRSRGFDPHSEEMGGDFAATVDMFRSSSFLEVAPVPTIEGLKRYVMNAGLETRDRDILWRAYDRQIRDELDHGAYFAEAYFMLTGLEVEPRDWDHLGFGGGNLSLPVPEVLEDPSANRVMIGLASAFGFGLESGALLVAFPILRRQLRGLEDSWAKSFLGLVQQIFKDEARHCAIHKYVFHTIVRPQGDPAVDRFRQIVNSGRVNFHADPLSLDDFARHFGKDGPPEPKALLGERFVTI